MLSHPAVGPSTMMDLQPFAAQISVSYLKLDSLSFRGVDIALPGVMNGVELSSFRYPLSCGQQLPTTWTSSINCLHCSFLFSCKLKLTH